MGSVNSPDIRLCEDIQKTEYFTIINYMKIFFLIIVDVRKIFYWNIKMYLNVTGLFCRGYVDFW